MKIPFKWEMISGTEVSVANTYRAKVLGGWLIKYSYIDSDGNGVSMVFVPDATHKWEIETN